MPPPGGEPQRPRRLQPSAPAASPTNCPPPTSPTAPFPPWIRRAAWGRSWLLDGLRFAEYVMQGFKLGSACVPSFLALPEKLIRAVSSGYSVAVGEFDGNLSTTGKKST